MSNDEVLLDQAAHVPIREESFQFLAGRAPGRTEYEKNVLVLPSRRGFCVREDAIGRGRLLRSGCYSANQEGARKC
jgi:hypothetical protein